MRPPPNLITGRLFGDYTPVTGSPEVEKYTRTAVTPGTEIIAPVIAFTVWGRPQQRGSKRAVLIPKRGGGWVTDKNGRPITAAKDDNEKSKDWMNQVRSAASDAFRGERLHGPLRVTFRFYFARPKCHYGTGRNATRLKDSAPVHHTSTPDLAKLVRCFEDALTGVVWDDDRQVCDYGYGTRKLWTETQERAEVTIECLEA